MQIIPTTATQVDKLKSLAKTRRKKDGVPLCAALDAVAQQHGYESWHHVTLCREQTLRSTAALELPSWGDLGFGAESPAFSLVETLAH